MREKRTIPEYMENSEIFGKVRSLFVNRLETWGRTSLAGSQKSNYRIAPRIQSIFYFSHFLRIHFHYQLLPNIEIYFLWQKFLCKFFPEIIFSL